MHGDRLTVCCDKLYHTIETVDCTWHSSSLWSWSQIWSKIAISAPVGGSTSVYCYTVWHGNKNLAIANRSRISCAHEFVKGISVTLKSTLRVTVTQGHWKRNHWTDHTRLTIWRVIGRWMLSWPWNVGQRSLKVIESGTIWQFGYGFLTFPTLTLGLEVKVIENSAVR